VNIAIYNMSSNGRKVRLTTEYGEDELSTSELY
jgi:hypothetical protein